MGVGQDQQSDTSSHFHGLQVTLKAVSKVCRMLSVALVSLWIKPLAVAGRTRGRGRGCRRDEAEFSTGSGLGLLGNWDGWCAGQARSEKDWNSAGPGLSSLKGSCWARLLLLTG